MIGSLSLDPVGYLLESSFPVYALAKTSKDWFRRRLGRASNETVPATSWTCTSDSRLVEAMGAIILVGTGFLNSRSRPSTADRAINRVNSR
jgi:hypothetical protein